MNDLDHSLLAIYLDNALIKNKGQAFEDFFIRAAIALWEDDFEPRNPQGSLGDKKCDGYLVSEKRVFQSYGPEHMDAKTTIKKITDDFNGAKKHFGTDMDRWTFVHNKYGGLHTETHEHIINLRKNNKKIDIKSWSPETITNKLMLMPTVKLRALFPNAPPADTLHHVPLGELNELIFEIGGSEPDPTLDSPISPSPEKITHNELPESIVALLKREELAASQVQRYFEDTSRTKSGEQIAEQFRLQYKNRRDAGHNNFQIFHGLLNSAGGLDVPEDRARATLGLISYLFHCCDIFENPPLEASS